MCGWRGSSKPGPAWGGGKCRSCVVTPPAASVNAPAEPLGIRHSELQDAHHVPYALPVPPEARGREHVVQCLAATHAINGGVVLLVSLGEERRSE